MTEALTDLTTLFEKCPPRPQVCLGCFKINFENTHILTHSGHVFCKVGVY